MNFTLYLASKTPGDKSTYCIARSHRVSIKSFEFKVFFKAFNQTTSTPWNAYPGTLERLSFIDNKSKLKLRLLREPLNRTTGYVQRKAESADCKLDDLFVLFSTSRELKRK